MGAMLGMRLEHAAERVSPHLDETRREAKNLQVVESS